MTRDAVAAGHLDTDPRRRRRGPRSRRVPEGSRGVLALLLAGLMQILSLACPLIAGWLVSVFNHE